MLVPAAKPKLAYWWTWTTFIWVGAVVLPFFWHTSRGHVASLALTNVAMVSLFATLGLLAEESIFGILITGHNTYSLSRLQMVLWTILVLSALLATTACRMSNGADGLLITIPTELLTAMGISFVSAAAAPAVLALKSQSDSTPDQIEAASWRMGEAISPAGQVVGRPVNSRPSLSDFVMGDDLATAGTIDLSKVQQLIITILLIVVYASALIYLFRYDPFGGKNANGIPTALPPFSKNFVNLLLVSHGGYIVYKATPKPNSDGGTPGRPTPPDRNQNLPTGG